MSSSFSEGFGKDSAYYSDKDNANFLSSSFNIPWVGEGCSSGCFSTNIGDYITQSIEIANTKISQFFKTGEEDLCVDVTNIISSTIKNDLPDEGFRITFDSQLETDQNTYFVKRFGSRQCYDEAKRPELIFKFDDSIEDDSSNFFIEKQSNLFLYNYDNFSLKNILSSSSELSGNNCLILELKTEVSGTGTYSLNFTGSQFSRGSNYLTGVYCATVSASLSDTNLKSNYDSSGSISFTPVWKSLDGTQVFSTGSLLTTISPQRFSSRLSKSNFTVSAALFNSDIKENQDVNVRINIFDDSDPLVVAKRVPVLSKSKIVRNAYYAIRDISTNIYVIPFDTIDKSTKLSSDYDGMYFNINTSPLVKGKNYVIDIMLLIDNIEKKYLDVSPVFRIV